MSKPIIQTLLARQGIYDKSGSVYAYELLYRRGDAIVSDVDNLNAQAGDAATSSVITQLFFNLDMDSLLGNKPAFINFTHNNLIQQIPGLLPKNRIVIEVLETVDIDQNLLDSLQNLKEQGYTIALDDFAYSQDKSVLIEFADIIKIDVLNLSKQQIASQLAHLRGFKGRLLAEKIEDKEQFNHCIELGFDYFQGFFFDKPSPQNGTVITENKAHLLRVLAELNNEHVGVDKIEDILLQIPKFSYRILRLVNSASFYSRRKIESLMDAIVQLGLVKIRAWLSLLLLTSIDDLALDLMERALIRAKMCELLSKVTGIANPQQAYMVGMFSTLDGILNEPMASLLAKIELSETLNEALLNHRGELGELLKLTIDYETANFNTLEQSSIKQADFVNAYLQGINHANSVMNSINMTM